MFNALTSIQNLINKNNIEGANYYLSIFSGLTRQVLDTNNEEMLSIQEELKILDDYLQMEQLRFGFRYQITADANLNQANIDIPAMLLQPFVENAVKHGVSALKEEGDIGIQISKENNDIVISIVDNGKGFNKELDATGYGMKLSEERVTLLNQIYKDQSITLTVDSNTTGTTITIRLTNWIP
jgi:LytS/YehU family sensor histidine kinase